MNQEFIEYMNSEIKEAYRVGYFVYAGMLQTVLDKYKQLHPKPQPTTLQGIEITADICDVSDMD